MEYRRMGHSGLQLSALSYGAWVTFGSQLSDAEATDMMALAYDHGVNFFDNAEGYANGAAEQRMGRAIRSLGWARDSFVVSSKVFFGSVAEPKPTQRGLGRKHLIHACEQALRRLDVDYLDLYYCHRPDPEVPIAEVVWTMDKLAAQGKILYWGTSEWSVAELDEAMEIARSSNLLAPSVEQPQYNLLHREQLERELLPLCARTGLGLTTWSPLASGMLTGKYQNSIPEGSRLAQPGMDFLKSRIVGDEAEWRRNVVKKLGELARDWNLSIAQMAVAWCLRLPQVSSVILGASTREQLAHNLAAGSLALSISQVHAIEEALIDA